MLRLYRDLAPGRAEAASARSLQIGALTYKSIASILANRLTASPVKETSAVVDHVNLRGPGYFHCNRPFWAAFGEEGAAR